MTESPGNLQRQLALALAQDRRQIGELMIHGNGPFILSHRDDSQDKQPRPALEIHRGPDAALTLARLDDQGEYRPLRSAPSLRHGWQLELADLQELQQALDFFYPAALGTWVASTHGALPVLDLRSKLERQTGMYRRARFLKADGARDLVLEQCGHGCLKRVLWQIGPTEPAPLQEDLADHQGEAPLYCFEACNLLVAKAREAAIEQVKQLK